MKKSILYLVLMLGLMSACTGKKADQANADSTNTYADSTKVNDKVPSDTTVDSISNAPADVKN